MKRVWPGQVLIVDDSPADLQALTAMLVQHGYDVRGARDGPAALRSARAAPPDLILLKVPIPEMDGYQVCRQLKEAPVTQEIPVILILDEGGDSAKGFEIGGADIVTKPFQAGEVLARVEAHLALQNLWGQVQTLSEQLGHEVAARAQIEAERDAAQTALRESEERFHSLITNMPSVIWTTDKKGNTIFISPSVESVYGYTPEEIFQARGELWRKRIHPDDIESVLEAYSALFAQDEIFDIEYRIQRKDGRWIWLHDRAINTYERDGMHYADGVFSDMTARVQAEFERDATLEALQRAHEESELRVQERTAELRATNQQLRKEIAERRQTEKHLQILSSVVEQSANLIVIIDREGKVEYANPAFLQLYELHSDEVVGKNWRSFIPLHSTLREKYPEIQQTVLGRGMMWRGEVTDRTKSGKVTWREATLFPIKDAKGEITHIVSISADITDRKWAEEALRESELKFRSVIEQSSDGVVLVDEQGKVAEWNRGMERITGVKRSETLDQPFWDVQFRLTPDERRAPAVYERMRSTTLDFLKTGQSAWANGILEQELQRPDGTTWIMRASIFPIETEKGIWIGSISRDVTERVRAEAALQESETRFRTLSAATFEGIVFTEHGRITDANRQFARILGYEMSELPGMEVGKLVAPEDRELVRNSILAGREEPYEHRSVRKDSTIIFVEVRPQMMPIDGRPMRVTAVRDITERKKAEEALRHYTERLRILYEINQAILSAQSAEAVARVAVVQIRQLIPCQRASVMLYDYAANEMEVLVVDMDAKTEVGRGRRLPLEPYANLIEIIEQGRVALWGTLDVRDATAERRYAEGVRSFASVPLIAQGALIGALNLGFAVSDPGTVFCGEHEEVALQVAGQLAIAIHQARLHEQVQRHAEELEQRVAGRTRELSVLYGVAALASQPLDLETMLTRSLERALEAVGSDAGVIHLLDEINRPSGNGTEGEKMLRLVAQQGIPPDLVAQIKHWPVDEGLGKWIVEHEKPLILPDITSDPRMTVTLPIEPLAYIGIPLRASGRTVGALAIIRRTDQPPLIVEEISLLTSIADQLGIVVESAGLRERAERAAVLEERERLARELHDSVTQLLYSINLFAKAGRDAYNQGNTVQGSAHLAQLGDIASQAIKEMRLLLYELRPRELEQEGFIGAIQHRLDAVEGRAGIRTQLLVDTAIKLSPKVEQELYHIVQEALNNALKHSQATSVQVQITADREWIGLEVTDDGVGFDPHNIPDEGGIGLINMRERAKKLGGKLAILSKLGRGTTVQLSLQEDTTKEVL